jgi:3-isopropylmalate/(R)-2-methylmalate dehydratase small subunit
MDAITVHTGVAAPLRRSNVDTDQIIPAEYLKRITRHGFEDALFAAWRADPEFVLNRPEYAHASILVAGSDFGTGSSREHAVWALHDYGFRVVLSSRFADIFRSNCGKAGVLAAIVPQEFLEKLWQRLEAHPGAEVTVDLQERTVSSGDLRSDLAVDDFDRFRLLNGLDDIGITERYVADIEAYEARRPAFLPKTR